MMTEPLFLNGEIIPLSEGRVPVEDRGFLFADGVYEAIRVYRGRPFTVLEHLERFVQSAAGLEIPLPYPLEQLEQICHDLIARTSYDQSTIYMQLTRGTARRAHAFPAEVKPTMMAFVRELKPLDTSVRQAGVQVITLPDQRWDRCDIKTIALLPNILASEQAHRAGANEALLVGADGTVYEGASSNVHGIKNGRLYTHPLCGKVLPGVTRQKTLQLTTEAGIPVHEKPCSLDWFKAADEVFLTSITREILPVRQIDETVIGSGEAGPITQQLYQSFLNFAAQNCGLEKCY